jgi:acyl-CoA synthetase (AMP-forming)/AMP-acid ligase II
MFPGAIAADAPNRPAVIMASTGQVITFKELDDAANRLSQVLRNAGLNPGDHVAFCIENHPRYFEILWGCHYAGLIYTACSSRLTTDELNYIINDCGAKAFITSKHKADQAAEVAKTTPNVSLRLMLDGKIAGYDSYEDTVSKAPATELSNRSPKRNQTRTRNDPARHAYFSKRAVFNVVRDRQRLDLSLTGTALSCCTPALHNDDTSTWRHCNHHGAF